MITIVYYLDIQVNHYRDRSDLFWICIQSRTGFMVVKDRSKSPIRPSGRRASRRRRAKAPTGVVSVGWGGWSGRLQSYLCFGGIYLELTYIDVVLVSLGGGTEMK